MSDRADSISFTLQGFGLTADEASLYLALAEKGELSVLKLSKQVHMGRTKVYRMLDKLIGLGLVEQVLGARGFTFKVTEYHHLNSLLAEKKSEVALLEQSLPTVIHLLESFEAKKQDEKRVLYFNGVEGFKQVTWNSLRAEKDLYIFEMVTDMSAYVDQGFSEKMREELLKRRIHTSQITNIRHIPEYTEVSGIIEKYWSVRYIDPKILKLSYEMLIYNDVVAMYNMRGDNLFCVEIHDRNLASMQKQLFKYIWSNAIEMEIVSMKGEARVTE